MNEVIQNIVPVLALSILAAGWAGVQILAKRMKTKNHIDNPDGCCGACENRQTCERKGVEV